MARVSHPGIYDAIGGGYASQRIPDARIAKRVAAALAGARTICNVGAGAGSYEPDDRQVFAVEPSREMIRQRASRRGLVRGVAEKLPFADDSFDAALAILTIHHWQNAKAGLAELRRIASRCVVFTFDPALQGSFWLVRDYLPAVVELGWDCAPPIDGIAEALGGGRVEAVPIPWNCTDGFQAAYWRRPERYLDPAVRASISTFALLPDEMVKAAIQRLGDDLASGAWAERNADILAQEEMDYGYRLVISPGPDPGCEGCDA